MTGPDARWHLDPAQGVKPLDFGGHGVMGSVDRDGRLIALNTLHPAHGYMTLTTAAPFPEAKRYDVAAVRAYRAALAGLEGFGPRFGAGVRARDAWLLDGAIPHVRIVLDDGSSVECTTFAWSGGAAQIWRHEGAPLTFEGALSLQRSAYTQLTEGGPVAMPAVEAAVDARDGVLVLENPALGRAVAVAGFAGIEWRVAPGGVVEVRATGHPGTTALWYAFGPDGAAAREQALILGQNAPADALARERAAWRALHDGAEWEPVVWRGLAYGRMLAVPVGEAACFLTDHMLLPQSWNRDAYYVARALLSWRRDMADLVRRHLLWMFEVAERPEGAWGRSYLANGRVKDPAYQLDQQLFPLLELAEYVAETGDGATWERLRGTVRAVVERLLAGRHPRAWLFPTQETPADDELPLPYHFSSHILLWHVFRLLDGLDPGADYADMAEQVRAAALLAFATDHEGRRLFAYATDGEGHFHLYHDANDTPLALAPAWGFVTADDPVWRGTVDFAFSPANEGGYYGGRLGSIHTRAAWPLGDAQDVLIARALGDAAREQAAWDRLRRAAQWDGALPEAVDPASDAVVSRHWFAWPNALAAWLALGGASVRSE